MRRFFSLYDEQTYRSAVFLVDNVLLSYSSLPNEGVVQVVTNTRGTKVVGWQSLKNSFDDVICRQLGYNNVTSYFNKTVPSGSTDEIFSGRIDCSGGEKHLSQCSITTSTQTCSSGLSYIKCKFLDKYRAG